MSTGDQETVCTHWHFVSADEATSQDTYAFSEAPDFNPDECPTVKVAHGHRVVCDDCRMDLVRQGRWPLSEIAPSSGE